MELSDILNRQIQIQQTILDDTDKYVVRAFELSEPVYPETLALRAQAREAIKNYRAQIEALQAQA